MPLLPVDKESIPASAGAVGFLLAIGPSGGGGTKNRPDFRRLISQSDSGVSVGA